MDFSNVLDSDSDNDNDNDKITMNIHWYSSFLTTFTASKIVCDDGHITALIGRENGRNGGHIRHIRQERIFQVYG